MCESPVSSKVFFNSSNTSQENQSSVIVINDERYAVDHLSVAKKHKEFISEIVIPYGLITDRIQKLAYDIAQKYQYKELHMICILKGSRLFFSHLLSALETLSINDAGNSCPSFIEHYIRIKSYKGTISSKSFNFIHDDLQALENKSVLIVEDIIDTGFTLDRFCSYLRTNVKPLDVAVVSLLEKRTERSNGFKGDFIGFSIPDVFVVGFGMDFEEKLRDLRHISILKKSVFQGL